MLMLVLVTDGSLSVSRGQVRPYIHAENLDYSHQTDAVTVNKTNDPLPVSSTPNVPTTSSGLPVEPISASALEVREAGYIESPEYADEGWNPPSLNIQTARHPYDHFWFIRPVSASSVNYSLPYYHFGTDGPENSYRLHHGVDLSNPVGVEVRAAGSGTVIWADKGHFNTYEAITSYGNVIVIQHDFGYRGQNIYTLYAHLNDFVIEVGDHVEVGDVIGHIGQTGNVTGPHVHFEVRIGKDFYYNVRNPEMWMAPYVNTGIVLGRLETSLGNLVYDADLELIDPIRGFTRSRTSSYSGSGVQSDDLWNENFVFSNIPEGYYLVHAYHEDEYWTGEVRVTAGMSNWVDLIPSLPPDDEEQ